MRDARRLKQEQLLQSAVIKARLDGSRVPSAGMTLGLQGPTPWTTTQGLRASRCGPFISGPPRPRRIVAVCRQSAVRLICTAPDAWRSLRDLLFHTR